MHTSPAHRDRRLGPKAVELPLGGFDPESQQVYAKLRSPFEGGGRDGTGSAVLCPLFSLRPKDDSPCVPR